MLALAPSLANAAALRIRPLVFGFIAFGFDGLARFGLGFGNPVPLPFLELLTPMTNIDCAKEQRPKGDADTYRDQDSVGFNLSARPRCVYFLLEGFSRRQ